MADLSLDVTGELRLPAVAVLKQLFLGVEQLLTSARRVLIVWSFDNSIHRTSFLAEPAVDALGHVYVVASGASALFMTYLEPSARGSLSIVIARAGHAEAHSLQAMHLSSPVGYLLRACSPLNLGLIGPFSKG